jgi:crotonobetainyl-CoA:carnitine CoA-transferase CaiB-like acyl-CoA transferase
MEHALEGITVADFTQLMQGPWATQKLADMGAEVIKIEPPGGELIHETRAAGQLYQGESPFGLAMNRNKRSIALDLKSEEGSEVAEEIVADADVLVENFKPGVIDRLGFGYEDVQAYNEDIIYVSASGFGADGPYADRPGQDVLIQALSGIAATTGKRDEEPVTAGITVADALSAKAIALHTAIALFHRERTGEGQKIETNLLNAAIDVQSQEITAAVNLDVEWTRSEAGVATVAREAPYGIYETSDGYVAISMTPLEHLKEVIDLDELPPRETPQQQYEHRDEIHRAVQSATRAYATDDLLDLLLENDVWASEVKDLPDAARNPQVQHNEMMVEIDDHPTVDTYETTGIPVSMSETPGTIRSPPPRPGEHSEEILAELGYDDGTIDDLFDDHVVEAPEG